MFVLLGARAFQATCLFEFLLGIPSTYIDRIDSRFWQYSLRNHLSASSHNQKAE